MATLWGVSQPGSTMGSTMPMLMKVPKLGEQTDPADIVSFEMEQMILPRLSGLQVPKFVAAGEFAVRPYIVMEFIPGKTLLARLPDLPLPYEEVAEIG
jgi:non-specific serine/threonine protein kinase/protein-serine/threonine kinase